MFDQLSRLPSEFKDELITRLAELLSQSSHSDHRPPPMTPEMALLGAIGTLRDVEVVQIPAGADPEAFIAGVLGTAAEALTKAARH